MAKICNRSMKRVEKERNNIHESVNSTFTVFEKKGEKFLQIDTYGRASRENPQKISQSIQFGKETAFFLHNLLTKEFDLVNMEKIERSNV